MPLSEEEQRLLDQLEASLSADDPRLARTMRSHGSTTVETTRSPQRALASLVGVAIGLVVLIAGVQLHPAVGVLGFLVMLLSVLLGGDALRQRRVQRPQPTNIVHPSRIVTRDDL